MLIEPVSVFAQIPNPSTPTDYRDVVEILVDIGNTLIYVGMVAAVTVFIYGAMKFVSNAGNEQKLTEGKKSMFWGIIALFVLSTFLSIIFFFFQDAGFGSSLGIPFLPQ